MPLHFRMPAMVVLASFAMLVAACSHSSGTDTASSRPKTAPEWKKAAIDCLQHQDLSCAEHDFRGYLKLRPTDPRIIVNLGFVLNQQGRDREAIVQFEKAIDMGEGTYDLFASYTDSLGKVGRTDEAIDWSYKTLKLVPSLVDVRGNLARLLVQKKRYYEALTLLAEFDRYLDEHDQDPFFTAQRMAITAALERSGAGAPGGSTELRLVKLGASYYAPVQIGRSGVQAFMVDTGASTVVLNDTFLVRSKARYTITRRQAIARLADGHVATARIVIIDNMHVGPFELDDVKAIVCPTCSLLLGENALSNFDRQTRQVQGVDTMILQRHDRG